MIAEETASELLGVSMNRSRHHHLLDGDDELHYVGKEVDDDDPVTWGAYLSLPSFTVRYCYAFALKFLNLLCEMYISISLSISL